MKLKIIQLLKNLNDETDQKLVPVDLNIYVEKILERSTIISIVHSNNLHGFISYYDSNIKESFAFLTMLAIDKKYWNMGYGKSLLEFSIANLKTLGFKKYALEVLKDNYRAINFYKKAGFSLKEEKKQHYYMEIEL